MAKSHIYISKGLWHNRQDPLHTKPTTQKKTKKNTSLTLVVLRFRNPMNMIMERMISPTRPLVPSPLDFAFLSAGGAQPRPTQPFVNWFPIGYTEKPHKYILYTHTMAYLIRRECERLQAESEHIDSMTFSSVSSTGFTQIQKNRFPFQELTYPHPRPKACLSR